MMLRALTWRSAGMFDRSTKPNTLELATNVRALFLRINCLNYSATSEEPAAATKSQRLCKLGEAKLRLSFTCKRCSTRSTKIISKLSYEKGVIIVRCDGCKNNHLIADNLGWFNDQGGKTNIEYMMKAKGETIRTIRNCTDGSLEAVLNEDCPDICAK